MNGPPLAWMPRVGTRPRQFARPSGWACIATLFAMHHAVAVDVGLDAYRTRVADQAGDRVTLENRAEVRLTSGRLRMLSGFRPDAVLFRLGLRWSLWIDGEGLYECELEERPGEPAREAILGRLAEISADGSTLILDDRSKYEVEARDAATAARWRAGERVLVLEASRAINLDARYGVLRVRPAP